MIHVPGSKYRRVGDEPFPGRCEPPCLGARGDAVRNAKKPPTSRPYASLSVIQDGEPEIASSGAKINLVTVTYQITILVWSNAQLGNAEAIQAAAERSNWRGDEIHALDKQRLDPGEYAGGRAAD